MTRAAVVLALIVALTLGARSFAQGQMPIVGSGAALAFGFLLLAALQTGHIFHDLRLPHLTGFILCGAVFGPEVLGLMTSAMVRDLALVKGVAVGLIALLAGCELNFRRLLPRLGSIALFSAFGLAAAGLLLFGFFLAISTVLPVTAGMTVAQRVVVSLVCANALCALSPAVVMGILSETGAAGPLSSLALSIVVLADLAIVITFSLSSSVAGAVFPGQGGGGGFELLAAHIFGSIGVGLVIGLGLAIYMRRVRRRVALFIFGMFFVVAEAGIALHIDPLLCGLTAGLFLENVSPVSGHEVIKATEPAAMPTFAVFFATVGAEVHVHAFFAVAAYAVGAAATRAAGIWVGTRFAARFARREQRHVARLIPLGMLPQAGIALAIANLVKTAFQPWGEGMATLLIGAIVVNEMVGPILFRQALARAGEIGKKREGDSHAGEALPADRQPTGPIVIPAEPRVD